jgi:arsenate reductase (thioredoxin)
MADRIYNVLFLCTGNSARSIMAEAMMHQCGAGRFKAYSAGSHPTGQVNPLALETLQTMRMPIDGLRSKSWDEFAAPGAPPLDFVFTVCDKAAGEACPFWPGQPIAAHWGVEDPAAFEGPEDQKRRLFSAAAGILRRRIELFLSLPLESLDRMSLQQKLAEIGRSELIPGAPGRPEPPASRAP